MTRRRVVVLVAAGLAIAAAAASIVRVPPDALAGRSWAGGGTPDLLEPGWHLRLPVLQRVHRYPGGAVVARGEVTAASREGSEIRLPYEARVRPGRQELLALHQEGSPGGGAAALDRLVADQIRRAAAGIGTYDLASGQAASPIESSLRRALESRFGEGVAAIRIGPPGVPAEVRAAFEKEAIYARRRETGRKVLLVGIDGADWDLIDPMIARGELPHLARLKRDGARATLRSNIPTLSPLLWTTVATGKSPDRHGINDFLVADPRTGRRVPINSTFRRAKALWTILSEAGLDSGIIAWWATWPAEPIRGWLVSDRVAYSTFQVARPEGERGAVHPPEYASEVARLKVEEESVTYARIARFMRIGEREFREARGSPAAVQAGAPREGEEEARESIRLFVRALASTDTYRRIALDILQRDRAAGEALRLLAVYFQGVDEVNHRFAHCAPPRLRLCREEDYRRFRDTVAAFYRHQDAILGEILRAAGGDWTVLVISDHGFSSGAGRPDDVKPFIEGKPGLWHDLNGIFLAHGPGIGRGEIPTVSLYDIAPTILYLLGLPVPEDMPGKVLESALTADFRTGNPLARVPSYEGLSTDQGAGGESRATVLEDAAGEEMVAQLRALGYVGGGEEAPPAGGEVPTLLYHTNLGTVYLGRRQLEPAEAEFRKALAIDPESVQALSGMAVLHEIRGEPEKALEWLRTLQKTGQGDDQATIVKIAELFVRMGRAADGVAFMTGLERQPRPSGTPEAKERRREIGLRIALGLLYSASGNGKMAEEALTRALAIDPTSVLAMQELFGLYDATGRAPELEPRLRAALRQEPRSAMHHNWLGLVLRRKGDLAGAEAEFRRTLEASPDLAGAMANLGSLYLQQGRNDEAVAILRRALEKDQRNVESRTNLIVALGLTRDLDGARRLVDDAVGAGQRVALYHNALAYALHVNGRSEDALVEIGRSLEIDPRQPDALRLRSEIEAGDPARGLPYR